MATTVAEMLAQAGVDGRTVLLINGVIAGAAFVSSLTGFGYALVATPFLVLLFPPRLVVPLVMISWIPLAALLVREAYPRMQALRIGRWAVGAALGVPLGVYGLSAADPGTMRVAIGVLTLLAALTLWLKPARPVRREAWLAPVTGLVSGVMGGATGMSGPPVILFGLNQGWDPRELRANLIGYFACKHVMGVLFLVVFGVLDPHSLSLGIAALPGMLVGYRSGMALKERVAQRHFRVVAFSLVCVGGILAVIKH